MKKHYKVYYIGKGTGCYAEDYERIYIGDTWAESNKKACSNVRYRLRDKNNPNGGYATDIMGDSQGMGYVEFKFEAIED